MYVVKGQHERQKLKSSLKDTNREGIQEHAAAKALQACPTLCGPIDGSPPGSPVPGIPQARTLEWVAISFSNAWKWKVKVKSLSCVRLFATPWTAAYQAPPSMGFPRQEDWRGVPLPSPIQEHRGSQSQEQCWIRLIGPTITRVEKRYYHTHFTLKENWELSIGHVQSKTTELVGRRKWISTQVIKFPELRILQNAC